MNESQKEFTSNGTTDRRGAKWPLEAQHSAWVHYSIVHCSEKCPAETNARPHSIILALLLFCLHCLWSLDYSQTQGAALRRFISQQLSRSILNRMPSLNIAITLLNLCGSSHLEPLHWRLELLTWEEAAGRYQDNGRSPKNRGLFAVKGECSNAGWSYGRMNHFQEGLELLKMITH